MRRIGLREFNRNFYKQIQSVPFIVTKNKHPHLLVMAYPKNVANIDKANLYIADPTQFEMKSDEPTPDESPAEETEVAPGTPPEKTSLPSKLKQLLAKKIF